MNIIKKIKERIENVLNYRYKFYKISFDGFLL